MKSLSVNYRQLTIYNFDRTMLTLPCRQASINTTIINMMTVGDFLDFCKLRTQTQTDSNLARKVDITRAAIAAYRKGASFPSDENMLKLSQRAKLDEGECLLLLNIWRSDGNTQDVYRKMLLKLYPESFFQK